MCLDRHHQSPQEFTLSHGEKRLNARAEWIAAEDDLKHAWANDTDATEAGAYALALAGIEVVRGLVAVRRAEHGTGADYYLGPPGTKPEDLESCLRLEVSGVDRGSGSDLNMRLKQKEKQASEGKSNLPAIAAVVGFRALQIVSTDLEKA